MAEHTHLVALLAAASEIHAVALVDQREDAAGDRHPRGARVPGLILPEKIGLLARPERFELPTPRFVVWRCYLLWYAYVSP